MILVINSGSSSLKFKLFDSNLKILISGAVERIGLSDAFLQFIIGSRKEQVFFDCPNHAAALTQVLEVIEKNKIDLKKITKVGHRVVHGFEEFTKPTLITKTNLAKLERYNALAPLHNPHNVAGIKSCLKLLPHAANWAVFDTAFHRTLPDYAALYPIPLKYYKKYGIRKYGFHGISHEYVSGVAAKQLKKPLKKVNLITCHLGSGASITAVRGGVSVDTSLGFTPVEGLMMSTRSGDLDPSIPLFLKNKEPKLDVDKMLSFESGLYGISGLKDLRDIMAAAGLKENNYRSAIKFTAEMRSNARLALQMFIYRIRKYIGAYAAVLGRVDAIVFTAGIGERSAIVRDLIMADLPIRARRLVIPTDEEFMIAKLIK